MFKQLPQVDYLRQCFDYDPETGELTWCTRPREHFASAGAWSWYNKVYVGKPAGTVLKNGYRAVRFMQAGFKVHRIIWKLMTDEEPLVTIDHINGDPLDNRWVNLRAATPLQQTGNQRVNKVNKSGYRGVRFVAKDRKWKATIAKQYLGYFDTPEEAAVVYDAAARERYGEFYGGK